MKLKSKDIAKKLGVSPATISLVLNNRPGVSDARRAEIIKKIKEMGCDYLLKEETVDNGNIGFVIYKCRGTIIDEFPFFSYLLENINKTVQSYNYKLSMIYMDRRDALSEQEKVIANAGCKGFIVYAVEMYEDDLKLFEKLDLPCVFVDNSFRSREVDVVSIDNYLGVYQAVDYLCSMGHQELGYIRSNIAIPSFDERYDAFKRILAEKGMTLKKEHIMEVGYLEQETTKDVIEYLQKAKSLPTAFFADNDLLACRAVHGLKAQGYEVPSDISVIGFDNRPICTYVEPPVTTVAIPREDMGTAAVDIIMDKIDGRRQNCFKSLIGTSLIVRKSVKQLK